MSRNVDEYDQTNAKNHNGQSEQTVRPNHRGAKRGRTVATLPRVMPGPGTSSVTGAPDAIPVAGHAISIIQVQDMAS